MVTALHSFEFSIPMAVSNRAQKVEAKGVVCTQVLLGWCDIAGAGVVALTSLCLANGLEPVAIRLEGCEGGVGPVFNAACGQKGNLPHVMAFNTEKASIVVINTVPPKLHQGGFISSLLKYIVSNASKTFQSQGCLTIVGALRIRHKLASEGPYTFCLRDNVARPEFLDGLESLPSDLPVQDSTLAMLLHFCSAMGIPTRGLIIPGFKPASTSRAPIHPEGIANLMYALEKATHLKPPPSVGLVAETSWLEEQENGDTLMYC